MEILDRYLLKEGLKIPVVFRKICSLADEEELDFERLRKFADEYYEEYTEDEKMKLLDERFTVLRKSLDVYETLTGNNQDKASIFMKAFDVDDEKNNYVSEIVEFYKAVKETIKNGQQELNQV